MIHNQKFACILFLCILGTSCKNKESRQTGFAELVTGDYTEQYRPQYHFSPRANWMNDPNGLVYFRGEYHLFYQYYPDSTVWGPMHWGHAVSKDLIQWTHLPVALFPDSSGYIFSGSAVVDTANTTGFGTGNNSPLVAIYTIHDPLLEKQGSIVFQNQGIAYSIDKGRTWTKYSGNPVLKNPGIRDFRDPKVFWYDKDKKWVMIMAVYDRVHIYSSPDLKDWKFESEFGKNSGSHSGVWECPDLFPLNDPSGLTKWVMVVSINPGGPNRGSATQYFIGDFDGQKFTFTGNDSGWIDWGRDNYAGVTWSDIPTTDGRRIFIGWMSNWDYANVVPTYPWRSASTIPRELTLSNENGIYSIRSLPVRELSGIERPEGEVTVKPELISGEKEIFSDSALMQGKLNIEINLAENKADSIEFIFTNSEDEKFVIGYSVLKKNFYINRDEAGINGFSDRFNGIIRAPWSAGNSLKILILTDASSVEFFADDGRLVMTNLVFPVEKFTSLLLNSKGGSTMLTKVHFTRIKGIW